LLTTETPQRDQARPGIAHDMLRVTARSWQTWQRTWASFGIKKHGQGGRH